MSFWSSEKFSQALGTKPKGDKSQKWTGLAFDSRKDLEKKCFLALRGENFDAHDFLDSAYESGARVFIVDQVLDPEFPKDALVFTVSDTLQALHDLARAYRRSLKGLKIGAVTGSNGKTTVRSYTETLLQGLPHCHASQGSLNNHWGVPFTILDLPEDAEILIQEMGMNHLREIKALCEIAEPDLVGVTMVGQSHIGEIGSIEGIAQAKSEIYAFSPGASAIFNIDNPWTLKMKDSFERGRPRVLTFSEKNPDADIFLEIKDQNFEGLSLSGHIGELSGECRVPVWGKHNAANLAMAAAFALEFGQSASKIWSLLPDCQASWGRGQILRSPQGMPLLFDAYNANPESMNQLIENTAVLQKKRPQKLYLVLGEMLELGERGAALHRSLGEKVSTLNPEGVWFLGPSAESFREGFQALRGPSESSKKLLISDRYEESLAIQFADMLNPDGIVLIKGSRGVKLEQVLPNFGVAAPKK